jgi:short-subunit dehydrogenase
MIDTKIAKSPYIMKATDVARAGFAGLMKKKKIVIPGLINKLLAFTVRFTPRSVITLITRSLNQKETVSEVHKKI